MSTIAVLALVLLLLAVGVTVLAAVLLTRGSRRADAARAQEIRTDAASRAQSTLPPVQERADTAAADAAQARAAAEEAEARAAAAEAEADRARLAAAQQEAAYEEQVRAADRLDPAVDHRADDYAPQVPGTADQQPVQEPGTQVAAEADTEAAPEPEAPADAATPLLPRRTPGAQSIPGSAAGNEDGRGSWFAKQPPSGPDA